MTNDNTFDAIELDFEQAEVFPVAASGLSPDERFFLRWKVRFGQGEEAKQWALANRTFIKDVQVKFRKLSGIYRSLDVQVVHDQRDKITYLDHHFAKGWITTLTASGALAWGEARLISDSQYPAHKTPPTAPAGVTDDMSNPEEFMLYRWEGVDPAKIDSVKAEIEAFTASTFAPVVNGETIGTGFTRLYCRGFREWQGDTDRAARIDLLVGKPRFSFKTRGAALTKMVDERYELYHVPRYIAQELIDSYHAVVGSSSQTRNPTETGHIDITIEVPNLDPAVDAIVTERSCSEIVTTTYYYNSSSPVPAPADASGVWYDGGWQMSRQNGLWSGSISKHEAIVTSVAEHVSATSPEADVSSRSWQGVRTNDLDEGGQAVPIPAMSSEKGKVKRLRRSKNRNCTQDIDYEEDVAKNQTATSTDETAAESTSTVLNTEGTDVGPATSPAGTIVTHEQAPTRHGNLRTVVRTRTAKDRVGSGYLSSAAQDSVDTEHTQADAPLVAPVAVVGKIVRRESSLTEFGRYATRELVITPKDQSGSSTSSEHTSTQAMETHTENAAALGVASANPGEVVVNQSSPTQSGKHATTRVVKTGVAVTTTVTMPDGDVIVIGKNQVRGALADLAAGYNALAYKMDSSGEQPAEFKDRFDWTLRANVRTVSYELYPKLISWKWKTEKKEPRKTYEYWVLSETGANQFMASFDAAGERDPAPAEKLHGAVSMAEGGRMFHCTIITSEST